MSKIQKIVYAKGSSNIIAKLRGTYNVSGSTTNAPIVITDLQKSIFGGPPSAAAAVATNKGVETAKEDVSPVPQGLKRPREEESDEEDAPMDEESDVPMEASSDED